MDDATTIGTVSAVVAAAVGAAAREVYKRRKGSKPDAEDGHDSTGGGGTARHDALAVELAHVRKDLDDHRSESRRQHEELREATHGDVAALREIVADLEADVAVVLDRTGDGGGSRSGARRRGR